MGIVPRKINIPLNYWLLNADVAYRIRQESENTWNYEDVGSKPEGSWYNVSLQIGKNISKI